MSGKRFTFYYERGNEVVIEDNGKRLSNKKLVGLLNKQQSTIEQKDKEIAELDQQCADLLGDKIKALEEFEECTDKLKAKILEQQAIIQSLKEENRKLKNIHWY
jgi:hypothetical protein